MSASFKKISRILRSPLNRQTALRRLRKFHAKPRNLEELVGFAMNFGTAGFYKVTTAQIKSEILALVKTVANERPAVIVEIGTDEGGTCFLWANLASQKVISCDLRHNHVVHEFYKAFPSNDSRCDVVLLTGDSHEKDMGKQVEKELDGKKVDFLFIDGDHTESGVEADYYAYRDFVRPGGLIAFHDIVEKQPVPGNQVYYFWKRLPDTIDKKEFINDRRQCGFGIGVIQKEVD